ncbi:pyruvate synthase subunit beta [Candidatus Pacearchaeota archaeon]|nr:pyruvate synthase subunit beta [Candidatus Pacearchaeota archaeon]
MKENEKERFMPGHGACAGCGAAIAMRAIGRAAGKNSILTIATGCMEVVSTAYPLTAWKLPIIHSAFENAAATASGIAAALKHQKKKTNVIAIAGDGGVFDIGLQALSGALERGHKFLFICYDNEAYANTGVQRSGATPLGAVTTTTPAGKHDSIEFKKNMPFIVASHAGTYVATANIAFIDDFENKIKKALQSGKPSYIQVFTPCTIGWHINNNDTIRLSKLAYQTNIYPLFEIENGIIKLMENTSKIPIENYLNMQGRFKNLGKKEISEIQKDVDKNYELLKSLNGKKIFLN